MPQYTVKQGDCMSAIAHKFGFADPKTIWDAPQNESLRQQRHDFNVLHPGDVLFIPARDKKKEELKPGQKQKIQVTLPKKKLHLVLFDKKGQPLKNTDYVLKIGSETLKGNTGGGGAVEQMIPGDATSATLTYGKETRTLNIGDLNPVEHTADDGLSGIQQRLKNLGLLVEHEAGFYCEKTRKAVKDFQKWWNLEVTGTLDDAFRKTLDLVHRYEKKEPEKKAPEKKQDAPKSGGGGGAVAALSVVEKTALPDTPELCTAHPKKKKKKDDKATSVAANIINVLKPARKGTCDKCKAYSDCLDNDYNFMLSVAHMAEELSGDASNFMAIMHFESAHLFDPSVQNKDSGATGLIQFMPSTADKQFNTTTDKLAAMCRIAQLDYVKQYFVDQKKSYKDADYKQLADVVLAVFEPVGLKPEKVVLGVKEATCQKDGEGPYLKVDGTETDISEDMVAYYDKNGGKPAKDKGVLKDDSDTVVGISKAKWGSRYYRIKYKGETLTVTSHMLAVYKGNSGLDKDGDGFLLRTDYPGILEDTVLKKCGKDSCAKAADLQKQLSGSQLIICTAEE